MNNKKQIKTLFYLYNLELGKAVKICTLVIICIFTLIPILFSIFIKKEDNSPLYYIGTYIYSFIFIGMICPGFLLGYNSRQNKSWGKFLKSLPLSPVQVIGQKLILCAVVCLICTFFSAVPNIFCIGFIYGFNSPIIKYLLIATCLMFMYIILNYTFTGMLQFFTPSKVLQNIAQIIFMAVTVIPLVVLIRCIASETHELSMDAFTTLKVSEIMQIRAITGEELAFASIYYQYMDMLIDKFIVILYLSPLIFIALFVLIAFVGLKAYKKGANLR